MTFGRYAAAAAAMAGLLCSCGDSTGPAPGGGPGNGLLSAQVTDPAGDTFGNRGVEWDLTRMTVSRDTGGVTVTLEFSSNLVSPTSGDSNAMIAFVDFDTDQDSTTGSPTTVDEFRRDGGSTGMDSDYQIALSTYAADSTVTVFAASAAVTGHVKPIFSGSTVTIRVPRAMLGDDDGYLNASAIVGTLASPTDIIPESGHLRLGGAMPAPGGLAAASFAAGAARAVAGGAAWPVR